MEYYIVHADQDVLDQLQETTRELKSEEFYTITNIFDSYEDHIGIEHPSLHLDIREENDIEIMEEIIKKAGNPCPRKVKAVGGEDIIDGLSC